MDEELYNDDHEPGQHNYPGEAIDNHGRIQKVLLTFGLGSGSYAGQWCDEHNYPGKWRTEMYILDPEGVTRSRILTSCSCLNNEED